MHIAMIGLGRMGGNMVRRLSAAGHTITVYDVDPSPGEHLQRELSGVRAVPSLAALIESLPAPRTIWIMVPHRYVDDTIDGLLEAGLAADDVLIDGGNSNYRDSQRRAAMLAKHRVLFVDCGTSGGIWGLNNGYSLMAGGEPQAIERIIPILTALAANDGKAWAHVGPAGAGHFVKMVHNGIEYGMMQAFAEGFELLKHKREFELDMHQIARVWQHGSVVSSWLLDLIGDALAQDAELAALSDWMDDSGEGRWTVHESIELAVPTPVLTLALQMRFRSRQQSSYAGKIVNAMRAGFGGHAIKPAEEAP